MKWISPKSSVNILLERKIISKVFTIPFTLYSVVSIWTLVKFGEKTKQKILKGSFLGLNRKWGCISRNHLMQCAPKGIFSLPPEILFSVVKRIENFLQSSKILTQSIMKKKGRWRRLKLMYWSWSCFFAELRWSAVYRYLISRIVFFTHIFATSNYPLFPSLALPLPEKAIIKQINDK